MKALEVRNLRLAYGKREVLRGINLEVKHPSRVAVIGGNGSGKSTFAKVLVGQLRGRGEIRVLGKLVLGEEVYLPPSERGLAYVPQRNPVFPHLTVEENLRFAAKDESSLEEAIRAFELEHLLGLKGKELSGGQAKRVSIAMAFASGRKVIVMDEPLSGIDPFSRQSLIDTIAEVSEKRGVTVLWITHFKEVTEACEEVYEMKEGLLEKSPNLRF